MKDSVWRAGVRGIDPQHNSAAAQGAQGRRAREGRREPGKIRVCPVAMLMEGQVLDNTCIYM